MGKLDAEGFAKLVEAILAAITAVGPLGVGLYLKLEQLLQLGPDEQVNVAAAIKAGLAADENTIAVIEDWKRQVGLI